MSNLLIPMPTEWAETSDSFQINAQTMIMADSAEVPFSAETAAIAGTLSVMLFGRLGRYLEIGAGTLPSNFIRLSIAENSELGAEGYQLTVNQDGVLLRAAAPAGLFFGIQTLWQLIPLTGDLVIDGCVITDKPRFAYRAAMLDVSRHFFPVEDVKHFIDLMALYKFNKFHLHLTDDQGWRIEIKSWPNLTTHGGLTQVGGGKGGFYTQEEFTDIVAYAAKRYIEIIPEIDMPGHTNAALSSYPDLNPDGVDVPPLYTGTEVGFSTLTVHKDLTYAFIDDVVREIAALSPSPYFHIGGDESHATPMDDYRYFIQRVQKIVVSHGKTMVCWEEIGQAPIMSGTLAQHWFSDFAQKAVAQGGKAICSPASKIYMDMKYDESCPLGLTWAGTANTQQSYEWDPTTLMSGVDESEIVGLEAPLWTETIVTRADIEYMVFPRLLGVAEIGWSPATGRSWDEYRIRLAAHGKRLTALGVNFYRDPVVDWES